MGTEQTENERPGTTPGQLSEHSPLGSRPVRGRDDRFDRALIGLRAIVELAWVHSVVGGHEEAYATFESLQELAAGQGAMSSSRPA